MLHWFMTERHYKLGLGQLLVADRAQMKASPAKLCLNQGGNS